MTWCSKCGDVNDRRLYARISSGTHLCVDCWTRAGKPWPKREDISTKKQHEIEEAMRRRMLERGGTDRHMVRAGKT